MICEVSPKFCDGWDLLVVVEQLSESGSSGNKGGVPGVTHSFSDPLLQGSEQKVVTWERLDTDLQNGRWLQLCHDFGRQHGGLSNIGWFLRNIVVVDEQATLNSDIVFYSGIFLYAIHFFC